MPLVMKARKPQTHECPICCFPAVTFSRRTGKITTHSPGQARYSAGKSVCGGSNSLPQFLAAR